MSYIRKITQANLLKKRETDSFSLVEKASGELSLRDRIFDCSVGAALILLAGPLLLLISLYIKIVSSGPVIFKQVRIGKNGRRFMMFKFRTMHVHADSRIHESHAIHLIRENRSMEKLDEGKDSRVIPFGGLLRASGLDELPQIVNVFRGEMRIVGPRPCLPCEYAFYDESQQLRFSVEPGITGLWQVSGKNRLTFKQMIGLDEAYIRSRSIWLDFKILVRTPAILLGQLLLRNGACSRKVDFNAHIGSQNRAAG